MLGGTFQQVKLLCEKLLMSEGVSGNTASKHQGILIFQYLLETCLGRGRGRHNLGVSLLVSLREVIGVVSSDQAV